MLPGVMNFRLNSLLRGYKVNKTIEVIMYIRAGGLFNEEDWEILRSLLRDQPRPEQGSESLFIVRLAASGLPIPEESEIPCDSKEVYLSPGGPEAYCLKKKFGIDWSAKPLSAIPTEQLEWMAEFLTKSLVFAQENLPDE